MTRPQKLIVFTFHYVQDVISKAIASTLAVRQKCTLSNRRRCSRTRSEYKPRMRLKRNQSIEIETETPSDQLFEDEMVKGTDIANILYGILLE